MQLLVNNVDILPYIVSGGVKWSENDLDGKDAGRTLDGVMHRGRVAIKKKLEIVCKPLTQPQAKIVFDAVSDEYVTVRYDDPHDGSVTKIMYNSTRNAAVLVVYEDGTALWDGISFSLIER